tara:strand:- start:59098 stop:59469 length:372 start_codon:yes stop_codon:yes gene_type:complete
MWRQLPTLISATTRRWLRNLPGARTKFGIEKKARFPTLNPEFSVNFTPLVPQLSQSQAVTKDDYPGNFVRIGSITDWKDLFPGQRERFGTTNPAREHSIRPEFEHAVERIRSAPNLWNRLARS